MAQPVWILSVDLQTKTATFQTGMSDAAKAARDAFKDIKDGSKEMADGVAEASGATNYSMTEARHGVMMLGEEFGVHLPRGLTTFIASLGPVGAAMEMAFPFLAIILGATLLIEHLTKVGEAAEKAAEAGTKLDNDMTLGVNHAKEALIDAQIEARKLAGLDAWDLLAQKMQLKDVDKGIENVGRLEKALGDLVKANGATSNWNPFNWLDHSDDLAAKAKALQDQMQGKSQTDQASVAANALAIQSKVLEQMKGQTDVSDKQLKNQAAYVDFLKKETEQLQDQAKADAQAAANHQKKDNAYEAKKEEAERAKVTESWVRYFDSIQKMNDETARKRAEANKKAKDEDIKMQEEELRATEAVNKEIIDQQKERARIDQELGKEEADHTKKMAELTLAFSPDSRSLVSSGDDGQAFCAVQTRLLVAR